MGGSQPNLRIPGGTIENFGWPCYEGNNSGSNRQSSYDGLNLNMCEGLYNTGDTNVVAPHYARQHQAAGTHPGCNGTGGAISGLAFYEGGRYPAAYDGALFIADYSIGCIRVMFPSTPFGVPNKNTISTLIGDAAPVDLQIGPDGDLFYADIITGTIVRVNYNSGPTAVIDADPTTGSVPLQVNFDGTGSTDAEGDPLTLCLGPRRRRTVRRLDRQPAHLYLQHPRRRSPFGLRVQDPSGANDTESVVINPVANQAPVATISAPSSFAHLAQLVISISFSAEAPPTP